MYKRTRFVLVAFLVALSLWLSGLAPVEYRFGLSIGISAFAYIMSVWVLFDDLKGMEWITLLVLPVMFTLGSALFSNFLPNSIPRIFGKVFQVESAILFASIFRIFYYIFFAIGLYGVMLIENIFSVASIRTIQLFRAARSVNFILTLVTSLFFFTAILSLKLPFYWIFLGTFATSFVLSFPSFWSVDLKNNYVSEIGRFSLTVGWLVGLVSLVLAFWPIKPFMGGLVLTSVLYALLGVMEQRLSSKVYLESAVEYLATVFIIVIIGFLTTSWTGG
jgi:hypothetical protein